MTAYVIDEYVSQQPLRPDIRNLRPVRIEQSDELFDAGYRLLELVFDPAVLDAKDTYIELLSPGGLVLDGFPLVCAAAVFEHGGNKLIAGIAAGNLMWIDRQAGTLQLAIGNIATSPVLRSMGLRGVGSALVAAAFEIAREEAGKQGGELAYSVAEAEAASLGFWTKLGYLWPQGVSYLQPPLDFDDAGRPVHAEVPETLVVRPLANRERHQIDADVLRQMVLAIYRNWSIETNRRTLSPEALAAADEYVMRRVFPRVAATLPEHGRIQLVPPA